MGVIITNIRGVQYAVSEYFINAVRLKYLISFILLANILGSSSVLAQGEDLILTPQKRTIVQKCFLFLDGEKKTFCAAVGEPQRVHYAVDLSNGSIIKIWKGDFLDATTMWTGRGQEQLAKPLGRKILTLTDEPSFLSSINERSKDNAFAFNGYSLDDTGSPTFNYTFKGIKIKDRIWSEKDDTQRLNRTLKFLYGNAAPQNVLFKIAHGTTIERLKKNIFSIDGRSYVIEIESKLRVEPGIRETESGFDLYIPLSGIKNSEEFKYSILW